MPCASRKTTISGRPAAMPHSAEVRTKPAMLSSRYFLRPSRSVKKPASGMNTADPMR